MIFTQTASSIVCTSAGVACGTGTEIVNVSTPDAARVLCTVGGTGDSSETSITGSNGANGRFFAILEAAPNATDWAAGDWIVKLNLTTAFMKCVWQDVYICKLTSGCASPTTIASLTAQNLSLATAGVITFPTITTGSGTTAASDDKLYIVCVGDFPNGGGQTIGITFNQDVSTPIASGGVAKTLSDSATASANILANAAIPLGDTASASEALSVASSMKTLSDTASATDNLALGLQLQDSATASDVVSVQVPKTLSDTAIGADGILANAALQLGESGLCSDGILVNQAFPLGDTATCSDALSVDFGSIPKTLSDAAAATDNLSIAAALTLSDTAACSDALSVNTGSTSPVWIATGTARLTTNQTSLQTVLPSGRQTDDLLILAFCQPGPTTVTQDTDLAALGWTADARSPVQGTNGQLWQYYRRVDGAETAPNLTFSQSNDVVAHIHLIRSAGDVDAGNKGTAETATTVNTPSVTTTVDNDVLFVTFVNRLAGTPYGTLSAPANHTERVETDCGQSSGSGSDMSFSDRGPVATGTYSGDTFTATNAGGLKILSVAIKPAGGAVTKTLSDSAAGSENLSVAVATTINDTAVAADGLLIAAAIILSDAATTGDSLSVVQTASVVLSDSGAGSDSLSVAVATVLSDVGAASDSLSVDTGSVQKTLSDAASCADGFALAATATLSDSSSASDALSATEGSASKTLSDAATASESLSAGAPYTRVQAATANGGNQSVLTLTPTFGASTTAHNLLVAIIGSDGNLGTVTYPSSGIWAEAISKDDSAGNGSIRILYCQDAPVGTAYQFSWTNSVKCGIELLEFAGNPTSGVLDGKNSGESSTVNIVTTSAVVNNANSLSIWGLSFTSSKTTTYSNVLNDYVADAAGEVTYGASTSKGHVRVFYDLTTPTGTTDSGCTLSVLPDQDSGHTATAIAVFKSVSVPATGAYWVDVGMAKASTDVTQLQSVLPGNYQIGDLLLMDFIHAGPDSATQDTNLEALGWTQAVGSPAKSSFGQMWRYWYIVDGNETAPLLTFSYANPAIVHIHSIRNHDGIDNSTSAVDSTEDGTGITSPSLLVAEKGVIFTAYGIRIAAPPNGTITTDVDYHEWVETATEQSSGAGAVLSLSSRGPLAAGTYSGDTFAPTVTNARDLLITTSILPAPTAVSKTLSDSGSATTNLFSSGSTEKALLETASATANLQVLQSKTLSDAGRCREFAGPVSYNLLPAVGCWHGVYPQQVSETETQAIARREVYSGKFDFIHDYRDISTSGGNSVMGKAEDVDLIDAGYIFFQSLATRIFGGTDYTWTQVKNGDLDASLHAIGAQIKTANRKLMIGLDIEFDGSSYDTEVQTDFVPMWQRVYDILMNQENCKDLLVWVWNPTGYSGNWSKLETLWPGHDYVDIVAWDPYRTTAPSGPAEIDTYGFYNHIRTQPWIEAERVDYMLAEWGVVQGAERAAWLDDIVASVKNYPKIRAVAYFDSTSYLTVVLDDVDSQNAFGRLGADPYFNQPHRIAEVPVTRILSDSATATDNLSGGNPAFYPTDTGTATEGLAIAATAKLSDSALETDRITGTPEIQLLSDSGSMATEALFVPAQGADSGSCLADNLSVDSSTLLNESAVGSDSLGFNLPITVDESATATEALVITSSPKLTDSATAVDSATATVPKVPSDTATAADSLSVAHQDLTLSESAVEDDQLIVAATATLNDDASVDEQFGADASLILSQFGVAFDSLRQRLPFSDPGLNIQADLPISETAGETEGAAYEVKILSDAGSATEGWMLSAAFDTARETEALILTGTARGTDGASATDSMTAIWLKILSENGACNDGPEPGGGGFMLSGDDLPKSSVVVEVIKSSSTVG